MTEWLYQQAGNLSPVLPDALVLRWAMPLFWAVVLTFLCLLCVQRHGRRFNPSGKTGVPAWAFAVVALWCVLPGPWAPAYWLGLAFQLPSLMAVLLCLSGLIWQDGIGAKPEAGFEPYLTGGRSKAAVCMALAGMLLGWVLLLDTFGVLPFAVYRLGFGSSALAVAAVLAAGVWVWLGAPFKLGERGRALPLALPNLLWVVLALYVLTRLPTGNVFDALIDPWLWVWLHVLAVRRLVVYFRARRLPLPTTPG